MTKATSIIPAGLQEVSGVTKPAPKKAKPKGNEDALFVRLDAAVLKQFRVLCAELDKSQKDGLSEALNLLFTRYGKPTIA